MCCRCDPNFLWYWNILSHISARIPIVSVPLSVSLLIFEDQHYTLIYSIEKSFWWDLVLTLRRDRGGKLPPPLDEYLKILKIGAPFQLLKFAFAHLTINSGPGIATGGHRCVAGHLQVAPSRPVLKFQRCSKFHENWYSDHFLDEKHDGTIHFWWKSIFDPQKAIFVFSA